MGSGEIDMEIILPLSTVTDDIKEKARLESLTIWRLSDRHSQTKLIWYENKTQKWTIENGYQLKHMNFS